jgi:hypothetical protein
MKKKAKRNTKHRHHVLGKLKPKLPPILEIPPDVEQEHIILAVPVTPNPQDPEGKSTWDRIKEAMGW